jgi:glycosyltransferase involved in cell wall biosynthesis
MRVLIIHTRYKLRGGEDSVVDNEAALLQAQGVSVDTLFFDNAEQTLLKLLQLPFNYGSYSATRSAIQAFHPDVVHIHNLHFSGSAAVIYAIRKAKLPVVMTLHNYRLLCPSGSLFHGGQLFLHSLSGKFPWAAVNAGVYQQSRVITFWLALSNYLHQKIGTYRLVDQFILLGEHSKAIFANAALSPYAHKMTVKPNFSPHSVEQATVENKQSHYLYVGRLTAEKGILVLLEAFAHNQLPLVIVGTGPLEEIVIEYAEKYPNLTFLAEQPLSKIYNLLTDTIALIFPSVWYETFGMVVIEAFSKAVPVIASNLGNIKFLVTDQLNGLTFESGNSDDLSRVALQYQQLTPFQKQEYQQHALQTYLNKYAPEHNFKQLLHIYQTAINTHSYRP